MNPSRLFAGCFLAAVGVSLAVPLLQYLLASDGVPAAEREVLTGGEPETRLDHSSGLGLWTATWISQPCGGDLRFDDDGGTVRLSFPH